MIFTTFSGGAFFLLCDESLSTGTSLVVTSTTLLLKRPQDNWWIRIPWLADLVAAYILEKTNHECFSETLFNGIYHDAGLVVLNGKWSKQDIVQWLKRFQKKIDDIAGSHFLKFTAVIWGMDKGDPTFLNSQQLYGEWIKVMVLYLKP